MAAPYQIKLYGSDYYTGCDADSITALASVEALTTYSSVDIDCFFVDPHHRKEGDDYDGLGGMNYSSGIRRWDYNIVTDFFKFPTALASIQAIENVLDNKYHWLHNESYPDTTLHTAGNVIAVNLQDELSIESTGKQFSITAKKLKYD